jgi:hypothetical protein
VHLPVPLSRLPDLITHADWGTQPTKRWIAAAVLQTDGSYLALAPEPVKEPGTLLQRLRASIGAQGTILAGFDFPIGLPLRYAQACGIGDFLEFLPRLGQGEWADFYNVAEQPQQINLHRPFYPLRPGNARQLHLLNSVDMQEMDNLRRRCELSHAGRRAAAPLFWTMGAQQAGKAAICGWRDMLGPGLRETPPGITIWPFSGQLVDLLQPGQTVIVETYPAEFYQHLGVKFNRYQGVHIGNLGGKRSQESRIRNSATLLGWQALAQVHLSPYLEAAIQAGFGSATDGEDRFDAVIGLFGMLNVIRRRREPGEPEDGTIRRLEGWILGQSTV